MAYENQKKIIARYFWKKWIKWSQGWNAEKHREMLSERRQLAAADAARKDASDIFYAAVVGYPTRRWKMRFTQLSR